MPFLGQCAQLFANKDDTVAHGRCLIVCEGRCPICMHGARCMQMDGA